jgi:hypothetical protein
LPIKYLHYIGIVAKIRPVDSILRTELAMSLDIMYKNLLFSPTTFLGIPTGSTSNYKTYSVKKEIAWVSTKLLKKPMGQKFSLFGTNYPSLMSMRSLK